MEEDEEEDHVGPRVLPELHCVLTLLKNEDEPNETCAAKKKGRKWAQMGGCGPRKEVCTAGIARAGSELFCQFAADAMTGPSFPKRG